MNRSYEFFFGTKFVHCIEFVSNKKLDQAIIAVFRVQTDMRGKRLQIKHNINDTLRSTRFVERSFSYFDYY